MQLSVFSWAAYFCRYVIRSLIQRHGRQCLRIPFDSFLGFLHYFQSSQLFFSFLILQAREAATFAHTPHFCCRCHDYNKSKTKSLSDRKFAIFHPPSEQYTSFPRSFLHLFTLPSFRAATVVLVQISGLWLSCFESASYMRFMYQSEIWIDNVWGSLLWLFPFWDSSILFSIHTFSGSLLWFPRPEIFRVFPCEPLITMLETMQTVFSPRPWKEKRTYIASYFPSFK